MFTIVMYFVALAPPVLLLIYGVYRLLRWVETKPWGRRLNRALGLALVVLVAALLIARPKISFPDVHHMFLYSAVLL